MTEKARILGMLYEYNDRDYEVVEKNGQLQLITEEGNVYKLKDKQVLEQGYFTPFIDSIDFATLAGDKCSGISFYSHDILYFDPPLPYEGEELTYIEVVYLNDDYLIIYSLNHDDELTRGAVGIVDRKLFMADVQNAEKEVIGNMFEIYNIKDSAERFKETKDRVEGAVKDMSEEKKNPDHKCNCGCQKAPEEVVDPLDFEHKIVGSKENDGTYLYICHDELNQRVDVMNVSFAGSKSLPGRKYSRATYSYEEYLEFIKQDFIVEVSDKEFNEFLNQKNHEVKLDTPPADYPLEELKHEEKKEDNPSSLKKSSKATKKTPTCHNCKEDLNDCECELWEL